MKNTRKFTKAILTLFLLLNVMILPPKKSSEYYDVHAGDIIFYSENDNGNPNNRNGDGNTNNNGNPDNNNSDGNTNDNGNNNGTGNGSHQKPDFPHSPFPDGERS